MRSLLIPALLLTMGTAAAGEQDVYKWTDQYGVTYYSDHKNAASAAQPVTLAPLEVVPAQQSANAGTEAAPNDPSVDAADDNGKATEMAALEFQDQAEFPVQSANRRHEIILYSWTDADGTRHYGNSDPKDLNAKVADGQQPDEDTIKTR